MRFPNTAVYKAIAGGLNRRSAGKPAIVGGAGRDVFVSLTFEQSDLESHKPSKHQRLFSVSASGCQSILPHSIPVSSAVKISTRHDEGYELRVCADPSDDKLVVLEIWKGHTQLRSTKPTVFSTVYDGGEFGGPAFSPDGSKLLMIVEPSEKKFQGLWEKPSEAASKQPAEDKFKYLPDFGERLVNKVQPQLALWDWQTDKLELLKLELADGEHPAHPAFTPDGEGAVLTVYDLSAFKYGLSACLNRPAQIRYIASHSEPQVSVTLTPEHYVAMCPKMSPDGTVMVFAAHKETFLGHSTCMELCSMNWPPTQEPTTSTVVPQVLSRSDDDNFNGFYGFHDQMNSLCFADQARTVMFQSLTAGEHVVHCVDLATAAVSRVSIPGKKGSTSFLGCRAQGTQGSTEAIVLLEWSNLCSPPEVWAGALGLGDECTQAWHCMTGADDAGGFWDPEHNQVLQHVKGVLADTILSTISIDSGAEALVLTSSGQTERASQGAVLWLHGGPHSMSSNNWSDQVALWLSMGLAVVIPNYRGSLGYGAQFAECLVGHAGVMDVEDCAKLAQKALEDYDQIDPTLSLIHISEPTRPY
eukprot:TRINITY_DN33106_c0_g1_i1.p1 TRINITY_DN33106_c0_g1~~TRINITY_DN33106_c0_g1_i1.p1  ORF type:complete len:585 (-),score=126.12 TRINITY_DN33106_c0_g1_i1:59-1813(-)